MANHTLKVPTNQNSEVWFQFINSELIITHNSRTFENVIVDFQNLSFLFTDDFVVLACIIELFHQKGSEIIFNGGTEKFNKHLDNIKFKRYWEPGFNREEFTIGNNHSTLCLWKINKERIEPYAKFAQSYFEENFLKNKNLLPIGANLSEVFNNIFDHSQAEISYIITQYFPNKKLLSFALCDLGIGIPTSVNSYLKSENKEVLADWVAIELATTLGFSVKSIPQNQGRGLDNLMSMVKSLKGELLIISNDGILTYDTEKGVMIGTDNYNFNGTLIKVIINEKYFETDDKEEEIWGF